MIPSPRQLFAAYVLSATAVVVAASGSVLYSETARVKLSIPPQRLEANVTLTSGDLHTQRIAASVTDSQQGTAGTVQISAVYAAGQVEFTCSSCQKYPLNIPPGTLVSTAKSLAYATETAAIITATVPAAAVAVRATAAGPAWNTDPNTVTTITNSPDSSLHVTNAAAITGGANARSAQVIQQSDFDSVRNELTARVNNHLQVELTAQAQGLNFIADPQPVLSLSSDHNVGDETPSFTITIAGKIGAFAFSESEAQKLLRSQLMARVPPNEELTADPIQANLQMLAISNGDMVVTEKAVGFVVPKLSQQSVSSQVRGLTPAQAARLLQRKAPGSLVEIQISPAAVPWLPLVAQHISVTIVVEPALVPLKGI